MSRVVVRSGVSCDLKVKEEACSDMLLLEEAGIMPHDTCSIRHSS